ncbi:MAG: hypothetical protein ACM3XZ_03335 [Betaproteobacteria bacterium]
MSGWRWTGIPYERAIATVELVEPESIKMTSSVNPTFLTSSAALMTPPDRLLLVKARQEYGDPAPQPFLPVEEQGRE